MFADAGSGRPTGDDRRGHEDAFPVGVAQALVTEVDEGVGLGGRGDIDADPFSRCQLDFVFDFD